MQAQGAAVGVLRLRINTTVYQSRQVCAGENQEHSIVHEFLPADHGYRLKTRARAGQQHRRHVNNFLQAVAIAGADEQIASAQRISAPRTWRSAKISVLKMSKHSDSPAQAQNFYLKIHQRQRRQDHHSGFVLESDWGRAQVQCAGKLTGPERNG